MNEMMTKEERLLVEAARVPGLEARLAELEALARRDVDAQKRYRLGHVGDCSCKLCAALSGSDPLPAAMMEYAEAALEAADVKDEWLAATRGEDKELAGRLCLEVIRTADLRDAALARVREIKEKAT